MMTNPDSIMAPSDKKKAFATTDSVFQNSKCLFIQYFDVIRAPWLTAIMVAKDILKDLVDMSATSGWQIDGWNEWYALRPTQNPIACFEPTEMVKKEIEEGRSIPIDQIMDTLLEKTEIFQLAKPLAFYDVLLRLSEYGNPADEVVIWTEKEYANVAEDIKESFGTNKIHYRYGPIETVLKDIPNDSTFVFSDITLVNVLVELQKIQYSSIIVAEPYGYNYNIDSNGDATLKINLEEIGKEYLFKFTMSETGLL